MYPLKVGHRRMELHRIVQAVLEEENKYEYNMLKEKDKHISGKESRIFTQKQVDRSMHNLLKRTADEVTYKQLMQNKIKQNRLWKLQLEEDDKWEETHPHQEEKLNSLILTALSHSFQVDAREKIKSGRVEVKTLVSGFSLAGFFSEAGWHLSARRVYQTCSRILDYQQSDQVLLRLDHLSHLLESATSSCQAEEATDLAQVVQNLLSNTPLLEERCSNLALAFKALSSYCLQRSQFNQSHAWALKALLALTPKNPTKVNHLFLSWIQININLEGCLLGLEIPDTPTSLL